MDCDQFLSRKNCSNKQGGDFRNGFEWLFSFESIKSKNMNEESQFPPTLFLYFLKTICERYKLRSV